jgi:hypothetical protein
MKKELSVLIVELVVFALTAFLVIYLPFPLQNALPLSTDKGAEAIYLSGKIFFLTSYAAVFLYQFFKKDNATGMAYLLMAIGLVFQLVPLFLRLLLQGETPSYTWPVVLLVLGGLLDIGLIFGLIVSNGRMALENKKAEGKSVDIHEEK